MELIMILRILLLCTFFVTFSSYAAVDVPIPNGGFEAGFAEFWATPQAGVPGVVTHAGYPHPNNSTLGTYFGYYSPGDNFGNSVWFGQLIGTNYTTYTGYRFNAWMSDGSSSTGFFDIGYLETPGDWNTYMPLASSKYHIVETWQQYDGVTYISDDAVVGQQIAVRFPPAPENTGGVWIDDVKFSILTVAPPIDWCNLQWPTAMVVTNIGGEAVSDTVYGQVWIDGVTPDPGVTPGLSAWLGYGPTNELPTAASWEWLPAVFNVDSGNNDEFMTNFTISSSVPAGTYGYCYKYQYDTNELPGHVYYGLGDGGGTYTIDTFDASKLGSLVVVPEPAIVSLLFCGLLFFIRRV